MPSWFLAGEGNLLFRIKDQIVGRAGGSVPEGHAFRGKRFAMGRGMGLASAG